MKRLHISAPGRICLFGEHQDYLGLPVLAAAVSLRIHLEAEPRRDGCFFLRMPDIGQEMRLEPNAPQEYAHRRDYLRAGLSVLQRLGWHWRQGCDITLHSEIPINAGASSSSALVVMWLRFLMTVGERMNCAAEPVAPEEIARLGHAVEVLEFGEAGGMMDHFCAALGGLLAIDTRPPYAASRLNNALPGLVLAHSQEPKATVETLTARRRDVEEGIRLLRERMPAFDLATTPLEEAAPELARLPVLPARRLRANLANRDLTRQARIALASEDLTAVGSLLLRHHAQLRDGLDLSLPKIETMLDAAMDAGALGGKINGSGGGGTLFVLAPGREDAVAEAFRRTGGIPYRISVAGEERAVG